MAKQRGLGMGLGALIQGPDSVNVTSSSTSPSTTNSARQKAPGVNELFGGKGINSKQSAKSARSIATKPAVKTEELAPTPGARFEFLSVASIEPNRSQPRTVFDEDELKGLADSIKEQGLLQPIRVREILENGLASGKYELIAGERRLRAHKIAKIKEIAAIIADVADDNMLTEALVENIQRSELNAIEVAASYRQLMDDFNMTQQKLSEKLGKSRTAIANTLRILNLPPKVQNRVSAGVLSEGHARALLGIKDADLQEKMANRIVAEGLSVRAVEEEVALSSSSSSSSDTKTAKTVKAVNSGLSSITLKIIEELADYLDTVVDVKGGKSGGKGQLVVYFADEADLKRLQKAIEGNS